MTMTKLEGLSLFFPCHNEAQNVEAVIRDALEVAGQVSKKHEVIIVDDGSKDGTGDIVLRIAKTHPNVRLVRHEMNRGYGEAMKSGFRAARLSWIFYSDGDRQFDMHELPDLVAKTSGADIVSGIRTQRKDSCTVY